LAIKEDYKMIGDMPQIAFFLVLVIIINWSFGQKTTYYMLIVIAFATVLVRLNEIMGIFKGTTLILNKGNEDENWGDFNVKPFTGGSNA
jgi:hypothetical protein